MSDVDPGERAALIALVERLIANDFADEDAHDRALADLAARVPHPEVSGLIHWWQDHFDHEPTATEVVDRALAHRAIEL